MPSYPNRCQHLRVNGTQCGSPALRRNRFCYFHKRHHEERVALHLDQLTNDRLAETKRRRRIIIDLPVLEDANSIQVSLMQIMRLLITGELDGKTAGLLLYALQTASANLPRTKFEPEIHDVVLDPSNVDETPLGEYVWEDSDFPQNGRQDGEPVDPAREEGIQKAAEYLYELDLRTGGVQGFAPKPAPKPPTRAAQPTARDVRKQIAEEVRKAAPQILAANPELSPH